MGANYYLIGDIGIKIISNLTNPLYRIGGFSIFSADKMANLSPLIIMDTRGSYDALEGGNAGFLETSMIYSISTEDLGMLYHYSDSKGKYIFRMVELDGKKTIVVIDYNAENGSINVLSNWDEIKSASALRFSLWVAYGIIATYCHIIPIHSSTIVYNKQAVLFLGESGTGKSTHTKLWIGNIPGAFLLNDDCPIVSAASERVIAYGSPWSGKTPCYVNENYPIAAFVRIVRAPYNKMTRLSTLGAFTAIYPSCPPALAHDSALFDIICQVLSSIIEKVPTYQLECLPNNDAALLSFNTLFTDGQ